MNVVFFWLGLFFNVLGISGVVGFMKLSGIMICVNKDDLFGSGQMNLIFDCLIVSQGMQFVMFSGLKVSSDSCCDGNFQNFVVCYVVVDVSVVGRNFKNFEFVFSFDYFVCELL